MRQADTRCPLANYLDSTRHPVKPRLQGIQFQYINLVSQFFYIFFWSKVLKNCIRKIGCILVLFENVCTVHSEAQSVEYREFFPRLCLKGVFLFDFQKSSLGNINDFQCFVSFEEKFSMYFSS